MVNEATLEDSYDVFPLPSPYPNQRRTIKIRSPQSVKMVKSMSSILLLVCVTFLVIVSSPWNAAQGDTLIGSCVWGGVDYTSDCNGECRRRGHRGGHCGSAFNVNCWCEH
ncbi:unnamed protein product [Bemisia tabaci]|uniref:Invertebrate defensins family profile domain-containing protein n=1 Tax=Bemisia tabaci TaxID=7038 RepID=A0A9P0F6R3_BEMTA|nr:unnamed protein product [Bemisia tabaci]